MGTRKIRVASLFGSRLEALNMLLRSHITPWEKSREIVRFYRHIAEEVEAFAAEAGRLRAEFGDGAEGEEYERRAAVLEEAEITVEIPVLREENFLSASDIPSPAEMLLLEEIIDFA